MVTRIEKTRSRRCVALLGVLFLLIFVVLLGIGAGAPEVLVFFGDTKGALLQYDTNLAVNTYFAQFDVKREHQLFWVDLRLSTGEEGALEETLGVGQIANINLDISFKVEVLDGDNELKEVENFEKVFTQECDVSEPWCDGFFVWRRDFVDYDQYVVTVQLPDPDPYLIFGERDTTGPLFEMEAKVTAVNPEFTRFEIGWKYAWFVATLLVMFAPKGWGYISMLRARHAETGEERTYQQQWTAALLWALLWFDDPFVALTVYTDWARFFSGLFIVSSSVFVVLLLLFWLCFLTDLRFMQHRRDEIRHGLWYWIPKITLTSVIGLLIFSGYLYYRFWDSLSPNYSGLDAEKPRANFFAGSLGTLMTLYVLWVIFLILRSCGTLRRASLSYILLYAVTVLTCLVAVIGVFVAAYYPYSGSGVAFVGIHGLLNLYVWSLAASFAPVDSGSESFPKGNHHVGEMPTVVVGGTAAIINGEHTAWTSEDLPSIDQDFKAVEL